MRGASCAALFSLFGTMKLGDLVKRISQMSETELADFIREMRHNRFVERPAAKQRERRQSRGVVRKVQKLARALPKEELIKLIKEVEK